MPDKRRQEKKSKGRLHGSDAYLSISLVLATIFYWTPAIDPFAAPKLVLILCLALFLLPSVALTGVTLVRSEPLLFSLSLLLIFAFSYQIIAADVRHVALYGVQGRGTGALLYIAVIVVSIALVAISWHKNFGGLEQGLISLALINGLYGTLQNFGVDPIPWRLVYEGVVGFYGNPNFMSTMSGLGVVAATGFLLRSTPSRLKGILGLALLFNFISLFGSASTQGWVVAALGLLPIFYTKFRSRKAGSEKLLAFFYALATGLGALAFFNVGPLRALLYQESIGFRFDFWRIAMRMISDHPWLGVGIDRFQNFYRFYKDEDQVMRLGAEEFSDAAHNTYLHLAATGGLPLATVYLMLNLLIFFRAMKTLQSNRDDTVYPIYFGVWLGVQAQSLISVDQPAIVLLGWVMAGLLIGKSKKVITPPESPSRILAARHLAVLAIIPGLAVAIPLMQTQTKLQTAFYAVVEEGDYAAARIKADLFAEIENVEPGNPIIPIYAANSLYVDKAYQEAAEASMRAITIDPTDYRAWWFLASSLESIDRKTAIEARSETIKLSPLNVDDLLNQVKNYISVGDLAKAKSLSERISQISPGSSQDVEAKTLTG